MHGRAAGAVGQGNPPADGGHEEASPACRLRVRTGRHGLGLPVQRTAGGLAAGDGPGPGARRWDWALEVAGLLEGRYADCEKITLVCDNLNTHTKGALYKVFEPTRARQLVRRIEFCYTPKHGSWLNIAENELSAMTRQCLRGRRIGDLKTLHGEVLAWSTDVNGRQRGVDWQMKVDDARCKLKSVYPKIMT